METASNRIVVGVDGSQGSFAALRWALREAQATGSELEVVHVWMDPWSIGGPPSLFGAGRHGLALLKAELREWVRQAAASEDVEGVHVVEKVVAGRPAETLAERASGGLLLVVGTTGMTGLQRWMLGSVGERCAQISHVPVVLVPKPATRASGEESDGEGREHALFHVVMGTD